MVKRRILVHIGTGKTGSTSIQRALTVNARRLRSRGVLYPSSVRRRLWTGRIDINHFRLHHALLKGRERPWRKLQREIEASDAHTVVLSAEIFALWSWSGRVDDVLARLGDHDVEVIVYHRNQLDKAASRYRQALTHGDFDGTFREHLEAKIGSYNYVVPMVQWADRLGPSAMHVHCYDAIGGGDVVAHFLAHLEGVDTSDLRSVAPQNVRFSDEAVHTLRWINAKCARIPPLHRALKGAARQLARFEHGPVQRFGARLAAREGPLTPPEDLAWLAAHPSLHEWNDDFRRRWPEHADARLFVDGDGAARPRTLAP